MSLIASNLAPEIVSCLESLGDKRTASIRRVRREFSRRTKKEPPEAVFNLALSLLKDRAVPRFFAFELIQHHKGSANQLNARELNKLSAGLDSWDSVDAFACFLSGPAWRRGQVPDSFIANWAKSKNRWMRRTAVVSTVPLNNRTRGGTGDTSRTLQICRLVVPDRDDMVVKALSWALRELSKRDPQAVANFIDVEKHNLSARVLREVTNKLKTGLKNPKNKSHC